MAVLLVADHDNRALHDATARALTAAAQMAGDTPVAVLVAGQDCAAVAEQAAGLAGVGSVLHADGAVFAHRLAEPMAALLAGLADGHSHIVAPATTTGKNIMPRLAALLDVMIVSDIIGVEAPDTFVRPIYAGNAIQTVRSADAVKVVTVRGTAFAPATVSIGAGPAPASIEAGAGAADDPGVSAWVEDRVRESDRPDLSSARVVVSGGRGLGSKENFAMLERLAGKLGAAVGASRAAVDAGFAPNELQVGQTGKAVAPDLYVAIGISGAIQHLAGMKDSKIIVAINKDADAPIFQVADYGLVADLFEAVPALEAEL